MGGRTEVSCSLAEKHSMLPQVAMLSRPASLLAFYTNGIYQRKISDDHLADIGLLKNKLRVCIRNIGPGIPARTAFSAILDTGLARRNQLRLPVNNICHSKGLIQVPASPALRKTADAVLILMKTSPETPVSIGIRLRQKLAGDVTSRATPTCKSCIKRTLINSSLNQLRFRRCLI